MNWETNDSNKANEHFPVFFQTNLKNSTFFHALEKVSDFWLCVCEFFRF